MTADPLTPPAGLGTQLRGHANPKWDGVPVLTVCSSMNPMTQIHCTGQVSRITWMGCINEHLGQSGWCGAHYSILLAQKDCLVCGIEGCGRPVTIIKTEDC